MEKNNRKSRQSSKNSDASDKSSKKEEPARDRDTEGSSRDNKDGVSETSDEDEVVNYPNQPPIQNGFVVFIHQLNLATTTKEKRTVVEWISLRLRSMSDNSMSVLFKETLTFVQDALKMLDITPETITVDKMMEQSIATCVKPKLPIIKFSRPPAGKKHTEDPETNAPSFRFRSKNRKTSENEHNGTDSDTGSPKPKSAYNTKLSQSRKKLKNDKSKTGPITPLAAGQNPYSTGKGGKLTTQKSVNSTSSKGLQRKSGRPIKPQIIEDKKQEFGVQLSILRDKCRTMQRENNKFVWVLLIESRRRCIVDMAKLNSLASKFRFKVRWIPAQAPRVLDQSVFAVVNDIVQTKNICFPEQMKGESHHRNTKESKQPEVKQKQGKQMAKMPYVEILHKTLSAQFDVSSYASFEISQYVEVSSPPAVPCSNSGFTTNGDFFGEAAEEVPPPQEKKRKSSKSPSPSPTPTPTEVDNVGTPEENVAVPKPNSMVDTNESVSTNSSQTSVFAASSSTKNYDPSQIATVQLALIEENNPFVMAPEKYDILNLNNIFLYPDLDWGEAKCGTSEDCDIIQNGNEEEMIRIFNSIKSVIVIIRDQIKGDSNSDSNNRLSMILKHALCKEQIQSCIIAASDFVTNPTTIQALENVTQDVTLEAEHYDFQDKVITDPKLLIEQELDHKLGDNLFQVIIVDVEDESLVQMWSVYQYAVKIGFKALTLEKQSDGSYEKNLKKVMHYIRRRFKQARQTNSVWRSPTATLSLSSGELLHSVGISGNNSSTTIKSCKSIVTEKSISYLLNSFKFKYPVKVGKRKSADFITKWKPGNITNVCELCKPSRVKKSFSWMALLGEEAEENGNIEAKCLSYTVLNSEIINESPSANSLQILANQQQDKKVSRKLSEINEAALNLLGVSNSEPLSSSSLQTTQNETIETDIFGFILGPPTVPNLDDSEFLPSTYSTVNCNNNNSDGDGVTDEVENQSEVTQSGTDTDTDTLHTTSDSTTDDGCKEFSNQLNILNDEDDFFHLETVSTPQLDLLDNLLEPINNNCLTTSPHLELSDDLLKPPETNDSPDEETKVEQLAIVNKASTVSHSHTNWKNLFEIHRHRKKNCTVATVSSKSDEELLLVEQNKDIKKRILKKGFFHKAAGFFHGVCRCGRKIRQIPKTLKFTNQKNSFVTATAKDSLKYEKGIYQYKTRKRHYLLKSQIAK